MKLLACRRNNKLEFPKRRQIKKYLQILQQLLCSRLCLATIVLNKFHSTVAMVYISTSDKSYILQRKAYPLLNLHMHALLVCTTAGEQNRNRTNTKVEYEETSRKE